MLLGGRGLPLVSEICEVHTVVPVQGEDINLDPATFAVLASVSNFFCTAIQKKPKDPFVCTFRTFS